MKPDRVAGIILAFDGNEYPAFNPQFTLGTCQFLAYSIQSSIRSCAISGWLAFGYRLQKDQVGGNSLVTTGKIGCTAATFLIEADIPGFIQPAHMTVQCPFGPYMDFKAVPFAYFKEHICRDVFPVQKLLFLLVKFLLPLRFLQPAFLLFLFFLLLPSLFLFLPVRFTACSKGTVSSPSSSKTRIDKRETWFPFSAS